MITYSKNFRILPTLFCSDESFILKKADEALCAPFLHITDVSCERSAGGLHDYYSEGTYWWPNPDTQDCLPYIRKDGQANPNNFQAHRLGLDQMRTNLVYVAAAYQISGEERYAEYGVQLLKEFFLNEATHMKPHLKYAQAIPGRRDGRGNGIIDTLHLCDVPFAVEALRGSFAMTNEIYCGLKEWFSDYLGWLLTSENGIEEMTQPNNHSICFFVQIAVFALFTDNERIAEFCRDTYKRYLLPQMQPDGSFPMELNRTRPYCYSIFVLDNMVTLCHILSTDTDNLWEYTLENGACIRKGVEFMMPYLLDKTLWPYTKDVEHFEAFPARASFMRFAGYTFGYSELLSLYETLPEETLDEEARRSIAIRVPDLWI